MAALNPAYLQQYAIKPITSSRDFKWHIKSKRNDGTVTRQEAEMAINHYSRDHNIKVQLNTNYILHISESLRLCFKVEGTDDMYMFLALLPPKDLSVMWKEDKKFKVYAGRRQVCSSQTTIFSPSAFVMFQSKVCTTLDQKARLSRDALILAQGDTVQTYVECLVAMIDPVRSVDFVCRGGKGTEAECVSLLDTVMSLWRDMLDSYSPGTEYQTEYLCRKHLEEHKELKQVITYSEKEIDDAKAKEEGVHAAVKQVVGDELMVESLGDLLVLHPFDETALVFLSSVFYAVIDCGSSQWYSFGLKLCFDHDKIESLSFDKVTSADKLSAIIQEKTKQVCNVKKMDDLLLEVCSHLPDPIDGAVKGKLGIYH